MKTGSLSEEIIKRLQTPAKGNSVTAHDPYGLIAASHVVAVEFATIAAANNYWRS
jgi:Hexameric tyrosine-coordinated heme protein (HTHP)